MSETVNILCSRIHCFNSYRKLYSYILQARNSAGNSRYVTVNNVHTVMESYRNPTYRAIINEAFLAIPDGKPLELVGKLKGNKEITRLFGATVMEKFIDWGRHDGIRHFFFGGNETTMLKIRAAVQERFPNAVIAGMISPPYAPFENWDNEGFIAAINQARPDFIWVGLGAPKQEQWMYRHQQQLQHGLMFGIGAGFDYLAGNTRHAPKWMKTLALEWLYRLAQEPRRLWRRYATTIPPFLLLTILELLGVKLKRGKHQKGKP